MCRCHSRGRVVAISGLVAALATLSAPMCAAGPDDTIAFRDVRVFDGSQVLPSATVVVKGGLIERVGPAGKIPDGARVVDGTGKTLMPGFFDCHVHTLDESQLRQAAVFGVTTVLDMGCDPAFAARIRAKQSAGEASEQADLFSAGAGALPVGGPKPLSAPPRLEFPTLAGPDQARAFVDDRIAEGSDYIKIRCGDGEQIGLGAGPKLSRETIAAVIRAAHARRKLAVAHVLELEDAREAVADGVDGLVHLFIDAPADEAFLRLAAERRPFIIPTLTALEGIMGRASGASLADDPDLAPDLPAAEARLLKTVNPLRSPRGSTAAERAVPGETARMLGATGVPILAGTDAPSLGVAYGVSLHRELELLVAAGLPPAEVLAGATARPARAFGLADRGRIAPGLRADLVLLDGDPTADIRATRKIVGVWKRGRPIDRHVWRERVRKEFEGGSSVAGIALPPAGSEGGLVSDFEAGEVRATFGAGWAASTDSMLGGKSSATLEVVEGGANGSRGALRIRGRVADRAEPRFAGAHFLPGRSQFEPANLSAKSSLSFWARGDGKRFSIMVFSRKGGFTPSVKEFIAVGDWKRYRFELKDFDGCDGSDITGLFLGGTQPGEYELWVDDVRFD
jgi:imidazolonepropionase-like amidohydrolase